jgi:hypothetical protein
MRERNLDEDSKMDSHTLPMIETIHQVLAKARLKSDATILSIFNNLKLVLDNPTQTDGSSSYDTTKLVNEIMDEKEDSPKLFVINLPEGDVIKSF